LRELDGEPADLTEEEQGTLDALNTEYAKIEADYQDADELPDEIDQRLGEIETARSAFEARSLIYDPADIARAGVFISIDAEGLLSIDRGRGMDVRREVLEIILFPTAHQDAAGGRGPRRLIMFFSIRSTTPPKATIMKNHEPRNETCSRHSQAELQVLCT
jgi:hypothetical protein